MRVRSSSAPTVRRRPNQRALSMASAAGSTKPLSSSRSRAVKGVVVGALDRDQADERASGRQRRRRCPEPALGDSPGPPALEQVRLAHDAVVAPMARRSGGGRRCVGTGLRHLRRRRAGRPPRWQSVSSKQQQHGRSVELEQVVQADHRGVEHVVEVERRRQGLGDPVERVEQRVGVGRRPRRSRASDCCRSASPKIRRA